MKLTELTESTHFEHSQKVSRISGLLAKYAGYYPQEVEIIEQAALYHDIGKCGIPDAILNKPGALTPQEFEVIKTHTKLGCEQIAETLRILSAAAVIAAQHHEHMDGKQGYIGLSGEEIHPYARLVAVADVYDALISHRSYKAPWDKNMVCEYLGNRAGLQFDMEIIAVLLAHVDEIMALYA